MYLYFFLKDLVMNKKKWPTRAEPNLKFCSSKIPKCQIYIGIKQRQAATEVQLPFFSFMATTLDPFLLQSQSLQKVSLLNSCQVTTSANDAKPHIWKCKHVDCFYVVQSEHLHIPPLLTLTHVLQRNREGHLYVTFPPEISYIKSRPISALVSL